MKNREFLTERTAAEKPRGRKTIDGFRGLKGRQSWRWRVGRALKAILRYLDFILSATKVIGEFIPSVILPVNIYQVYWISTMYWAWRIHHHHKKTKSLSSWSLHSRWASNTGFLCSTFVKRWLWFSMQNGRGTARQLLSGFCRRDREASGFLCHTLQGSIPDAPEEGVLCCFSARMVMTLCCSLISSPQYTLRGLAEAEQQSMAQKWPVLGSTFETFQSKRYEHVGCTLTIALGLKEKQMAAYSVHPRKTFPWSSCSFHPFTLHTHTNF